MSIFRSPTAPQTSLGLLILRVVVGGTFAAHGWVKLFGFGIGGVTGFFQSLGIPLPGVAAVLVTALELLGGILLVIGLLTRPVAAALAADMAGAIGFAKLHGGFFAPDGFEFELTLLAAAAALALTGAGEHSADARLGGRRG
jgi:putative oxidoreductase